MSRLTLRLPESLHHQLSRLAELEGVSLNHYIVYSLTRQMKFVEEPSGLEASEKAYKEQMARLGVATAAEIEMAMSSREEVEPESELPSEVVLRLKNRMGETQAPPQATKGYQPQAPALGR
jgi:uncharacterized protein (DUF1778 family)